MSLLLNLRLHRLCVSHHQGCLFTHVAVGRQLDVCLRGPFLFCTSPRLESPFRWGRRPVGNTSPKPFG